ncbi:MAG TPA: NAD(P)/FAD-dependent oxidoreductase [Gammaproteobacteria bacterium]|nr:NAD(P)/FAD-dependent oxidoreductase [Gammaproteobacteria bacterium]
MKKITVIGAGFAALTAVRQLRKKDKKCEITLIAPRAELHYLPSLIWVPSGLRKREDVVVPLDNFFRRMDVKFYQARVTGLREGGRMVETDRETISNEGLIIATGGRFIKKLPGIEHAITPCEGIDAVEKIRDRLDSMTGGTIAFGFSGNPKEPSAMRGGPMFEFLFGTDTLLKKQGRRDKFELVFFSPGAKPGNRLGPRAVTKLLDEMKKRDIHTHLGNKLTKLESNKVITEGGEFDADLIIFMPGMTGNKWVDNSELPRSAGGLIKASQHCRVETMEAVYVAGDSGSFPGPDWMPKQAHMADLQAEVAAKNLLAELDEQTADAVFKVELVCIVDSGDQGIMISRTEGRNIMLPGSQLFHWAKRFFEWWYLRQYR